MATNQELRQASVRAVTGTALTYQGDWHALFDANSIAAGPFNQRLLAYLNLSVTNTNLSGAMQAYAVSQGFRDWDSMGTFTPGGVAPPVLGPEATALIAAMTVQPTNARKVLINTFINSLISAGVWAKLDALWVLTAHDAQAARLNWPTPGTLTLTVVGSPTFITDHGYQGDGTAASLATGYAPGFGGAKAVQASNTLGVWTLAGSVVTGQLDFGNTMFSINSGSSTGFSIRDANTTGMTSTIAGTPVGHSAVTRTTTAGYTTYRQGVVAQTHSQGVLTLTNIPISILARNNAGTVAEWSPRTLGLVHSGSALTDPELLALYNAAATYLTALGN